MTWFKNRRMSVKLALAFGVCVLHFGVKMDFLYFRF